MTGAGSGMGREVTRLLWKKGARVAAVDMNEASLAAVAQEAPANACATFCLSVADRARVEALPAAVEEKLGPADGVINCAGIIQPFVRVHQLDFEAIERVFGVNWYGTLYVTKAFLPGLLQRPVAHVVNISSMGGFLPVPGQSIYGASKAAVKLFTEALHSELRDTAVRVTVVFPGAVNTNIAANSQVHIALPAEQSSIPMLDAREAGRQIVAGMEADRFRVLVGTDSRAMDLLYRLAPARAAAFIARQMKVLLAPVPSSKLPP